MSTRHSVRILILDGGSEFRGDLMELLQVHRYRIAHARSSASGVRKIASFDPHLIIQDIQDPGGRAARFPGVLRRLFGDTRPPVLIASYYPRSMCIPLGIEVQGYFNKSEDWESVLKEIRRVVAGAHAEFSERTNSHHVLLGEDDPEVSAIICKVFSRSGIDVTVAESGTKIIENFSTWQPDALVLKEVMPNMNADRTLAELKLLPRASEIPVVLYDDTHTYSTWMEHARPHIGAARRVVSSSDPHHLLKSVRSVLGSDANSP